MTTPNTFIILLPILLYKMPPKKKPRRESFKKKDQQAMVKSFLECEEEVVEEAVQKLDDSCHLKYKASKEI